MGDFEVELHRLQPEIEQPGIVNVVNVVPITEDGQQWFVVKAHNEILEAKDEEFAFL